MGHIYLSFIVEWLSLPEKTNVVARRNAERRLTGRGKFRHDNRNPRKAPLLSLRAAIASLARERKAVDSQNPLSGSLTLNQQSLSCGPFPQR
jgi:hypothetical protein